MLNIAKNFITNIVIGGKINPSLQKAFTAAQQYASKTANTISKINQKVSKSAEKSVSDSSKAFGKQNSMLANMASFAKKAAIGTAVVMGGKSMIEQASSLQQYRQTLNVVMKDQKKAAEMFKWATDFANKTPFETDEIVQATVKLQSYGVEAKKVMPIVGDMASVMGKSLNDAVEAVADAQTGELERLKEFGITKEMIVAEGAKKLAGIELVNNKGQITNQKAFNLAMFSLMKERFNGGMDLQSKTFKGAMSTVTGVFKTSLAQMAGISATGDVIKGSFFDVLTKGALKLGDVLSNLSNSGIFEKIGNGFGTGIAAVGNVIGSIGSKFTPFFDALNKSASISQGVYEGMQKTFGKGMAEVVSNFVGYFEFGTKGLVAFLKGDLSKASNFFYTMFPDEAESQGKVDKIIGFLKEIPKVFDTIKNTGKNFLGSDTNMIATTFQKIGPYIESAVLNIMSAFQKIAPYISIVVKLIGDTIAKLMPIISQVVTFIVSNVIPIFNNIVQFIATYIVPVIVNTVAKVIPIIVSIVQNVWTIMQAVLQRIMTFINFMLPFIQQAVLVVINTVSSVIQGITTVIGGIVSFITGVFTGNWSQAWQGIVDIFSGIFSTIGGIAKAPINAVIGLINGAISNLNTISVDIPSWVPGVGGQHFGVNIPQIPMLAKGGIATIPSICGEAGPEAVIPLVRNNPRSISLLNQTAKILGVPLTPLKPKTASKISTINDKSFSNGSRGDIIFYYSPNIQGNTSPEIKEALRDGYEEFKDYIERFFNEEGRIKYEQ